MKSNARLIFKLIRTRRDPFQVLTLLDLKDALHDCNSILDVGCGNRSPLSELGFERLVGIDGYQPSLDAAKANATHHELICGDIRHLDDHFEPGSFDACVALDVIEHLTKDDGYKLMKSMERIAKKTVVFFTPNGFLPQVNAEEDELQEHLSGWDPADVESHGYHVKGLLGPKSLRGEHHILKYRPKVLWSLIALTGHFFWTRNHPSSAAAILFSKSRSAQP